MIHELKILPVYLDDVRIGKKTFEIRKNDRNFKEGDLLALNEFAPEKGYTGNSCVVYVDYIMNNPEYVKEGYVIMGIKPCVVDVVSDIENEVPLATEGSVWCEQRAD